MAEETKVKAKEEVKEKAVGAPPAKIDSLAGLEAFSKAYEGKTVAGLENVTSDDIKMPKIKLCQPMSKEVSDEKCKAGQFINRTTGEAMDEVTVKLLTFRSSRVKWNKEFTRDEAPICRSYDGKVSTDGVICASCPDSQFGTNGEAPACRGCYSLLGLSSDGTPFRTTVSGTSISKTKDLITSFAMNNLPLFAVDTILSSSKESNQKGTYYVMNYARGAISDPKDIPKYEGMIKSLSEIFDRVIVADVNDSEMAMEHENSDGPAMF